MGIRAIRRRTDEAFTVHRRTDHRDIEGAGGGREDGGRLPQARHLLAAERLHGDDTTVPILAKGKTDNLTSAPLPDEPLLFRLESIRTYDPAVEIEPTP
ncbi:hypothetical protein D3C87_1727240 [compost metagenome]